MEDLCRRIQVEQDPEKFNELVALLNELLNDKSQRLEESQDSDKKSAT